MVLLSCKQTKGINAVAIYRDGFLEKKVVSVIDSELSVYESYIEGFKLAFSTLRLYLESNPSDTVVIECNNTVFTSWLKNCKPSQKHMLEFAEMWKELDKIQSRYKVVYSRVVKAEKYAYASFVTKIKLSNTFA